jgi:hypothetical protein
MPLPRFQLLELEDLPWFPPQSGTSPPTTCTSLRDGSICTGRWSRCYAVPSNNRPWRASWISAPAGVGQCWPSMKDLLANGIAVHFTLTDKYPNLTAFRSQLCASGPGHCGRIIFGINGAIVSDISFLEGCKQFCLSFPLAVF